MKSNSMVRYRNSTDNVLLGQCFERENFTTNFINIFVVVILPVSDLTNWVARAQGNSPVKLNVKTGPPPEVEMFNI